MNTQHLDALQLRLSHERSYLAAANMQAERKMRKVWIAQIEREIAAEKAFIGYVEPADISDDDLFNELSKP